MAELFGGRALQNFDCFGVVAKYKVDGNFTNNQAKRNNIRVQPSSSQKPVHFHRVSPHHVFPFFFEFLLFGCPFVSDLSNLY